MKIVYVNDVVYAYATGDPSATGGAERYGWHLSRALANAGWTVTIGVQDLLQAGEERQIDGVRFLGIGQGRSMRFLLVWYRFLKKERPDWCFWQCAGPSMGAVRGNSAMAWSSNSLFHDARSGRTASEGANAAKELVASL